MKEPSPHPHLEDIAKQDENNWGFMKVEGGTRAFDIAKGSQ